MDLKVFSEFDKIASLLDQEWVTVAQMRTICASCADKMEAKNIKRVKASVIVDQIKMAYGWHSLPTGWTKNSVKEFWAKLTGNAKHKVTKCIEKMLPHMGDGAGGFCAGLCDMVEGKSWRHEPRS